MPSFSTLMKHVFRRLVGSPMFAAVTLATIAIGVGANSAIFSVVNGVLLKPLPYPEEQRLVGVWQSVPQLGFPDAQLSPSDYFTFREENRTFQEFGLWGGDEVTVTRLGNPERVEALDVTDGTLQALGIQPVLGRWFTAKDDTPGSPDTTILTFGYWQRRFGSDRSVLGRRILVDGTPREVIGVMPQSFRFLDRKPELIFPFHFDRSKTFRGNFSYQGIARLKPGVTLAQANSDVARMIPIVNQKFAAPPGASSKIFEDIKILPNVRPLKRDVIGDLANLLWVLMGSIGVVLLIACANVANLLLVRAEGRQQELAIRSALGASWIQIARELLTESVGLGLAGGAAGLGLAYAALKVLLKIAPAYLPRLEDISIDARVLLFTLAISLLASLLFGLVPVIKYAAPSVSLALRSGGRTLSASKERHRARNALVVVQVALALVLLISSGLMMRTFQALRHVQPGFTNPGELQTLSVYIPEAQVKEPERVVRMLEEMERRISAIPGVSSVAFARSVPTDGYSSNDALYAEDRTYREGEFPAVRRYAFVAPGFFQTMGTPLLVGRDYTWTDIYEHRPVAIISENLADELWGSPSRAIGKRICDSIRRDPWREVIGIVANVHHDGADQKPPTTVYWPVLMTHFWGNDVFVQRDAAFAIRTARAGSASFVDEVRRTIWSVDADLPVASIRTMEELYRASMARSSFTLVMLAIAGGMALLLAVVGIYGVISYSVTQRQREIGIRIALGARNAEVTAMFVRDGARVAAIGILCGLAGALALSRLISSLLFEVHPIDPLTYTLVALGLIVTAVVASYLPALKATTVDPIEVLRAE